jgi:peroxiredoxin
MSSASTPTRLRPGDLAPDFALPAGDREGVVSLADYRGRRPVLLAFFRSLYCPFCRRQLVQLTAGAQQLARSGVATIAIVATAAGRARLYFRFRPSQLSVGADPELRTHRAYGLQTVERTPAGMALVEGAAAQMAQELGIPARPGHAREDILRFDGFEPLDSDRDDAARDQGLVIGQFLIDRDGIVRWMNIEKRPGERLTDDRLAAALSALPALETIPPPPRGA